MMIIFNLYSNFVHVESLPRFDAILLIHWRHADFSISKDVKMADTILTELHGNRTNMRGHASSYSILQTYWLWRFDSDGCDAMCSSRVRSSGRWQVETDYVQSFLRNRQCVIQLNSSGTLWSSNGLYPSCSSSSSFANEHAPCFVLRLDRVSICVAGFRSVKGFFV